jgi:uncharacterized protein
VTGGPGRALALRRPTEADLVALAVELGRPARGVLAVAYRCAHGVPAVIQTDPVLPGGTPFPTLYYLTCAPLTATVSRMESAGVMAQMNARLAAEPDLADRYRAAHDAYLAERNDLHDLGTSVSAGGMPTRVKCLHVLVAHSLAVGAGVNPLGDEAVALLPEYTRGGPVCATLPGAGPR